MNSESAPKTEESVAQDSAIGTGSATVGTAGGAWGENKLSDVVKGVAKSKNGSNNGHSQKHLLNGPTLNSNGGGSSSGASVTGATAAASSTVAATSGVATTTTTTATTSTKVTVVENLTSPMPNGDLAQSTLALTPPTSPGKKERPFATPAISGNTSKTTSRSQSVQANQQQQTGTPLAAPADANQTKTSAPPPGVSYAKMAEQNKDRLEQMAREVKERELEQERERRRVAQTSKLPSNDTHTRDS